MLEILAPATGIEPASPGRQPSRFSRFVHRQNGDDKSGISTAAPAEDLRVSGTRLGGQPSSSLGHDALHPGPEGEESVASGAQRGPRTPGLLFVREVLSQTELAAQAVLNRHGIPLFQGTTAILVSKEPPTGFEPVPSWLKARRPSCSRRRQVPLPLAYTMLVLHRGLSRKRASRTGDQPRPRLRCQLRDSNPRPPP